MAVEDVEGVDDHVGLGDGRDGGAGVARVCAGFRCRLSTRRGEARRKGMEVGRLGGHAGEMCKVRELRIASRSRGFGILIWSSFVSSINSLVFGVVGYHGLKGARCS